MPETSSLGDWVALHLLADAVGGILVQRALERYGDPSLVAHHLSPAGWRGLLGCREEHVERVLRSRVELRRCAEREIERCRQLGIEIVPLGHPSYPALLFELPDPPPVLFVRGSLLEPSVRIAVVGARRASAYGRRVSRALASGLAQRGVEIASGGARGIDAAAHEGALEAHGRTIAVVGSGLDDPYPRENRDLFERIAAQGAVVSEFLLGTPPRPANFPRRNRLISGLSVAVVLVEAAARSGSLITARHALDQGREVMAVPGPVTNHLSEGGHRLIQQGAKLVHGVDDVLEELSPLYRAALRPAPPPAQAEGVPKGAQPLSEDARAVLRALSDEPEGLHVDELAAALPLGMTRLQAALMELEIAGAAERLGGGFVAAAGKSPGLEV